MGFLIFDDEGVAKKNFATEPQRAQRKTQRIFLL
jgi:hypothetical protein